MCNFFLSVANDKLEQNLRSAQDTVKQLQMSREMDQKNFRDAAEMTVKWKMGEVEKQLEVYLQSLFRCVLYYMHSLYIYVYNTLEKQLEVYMHSLYLHVCTILYALSVYMCVVYDGEAA
jgi:hypothetical protein